MGLNGDCFQLAHFSQDMKYAISTTWLANPNQGYIHFPHSFWSSYKSLIHYGSEDFPCPLNGHIGLPNCVDHNL